MAKQILVTKELEKRLDKAGEYGVRNEDGELMAQVRFFDPTGSYTFVAYGGCRDPTYGWIFWGYGFMDREFGWEHGTVGLSQLQSIRCRFGLGIERDICVDGKQTVKSLLD